MTVAPFLQTARLDLRQAELSDAEDIYTFVRNPNVLRYTTGTPPNELSETVAFVRGLANRPEGSYAWSLRLKEEDRVIGTLEFSTGETGSVDYCLAEEYWGKGIMTEAVKAVMQWGFDTFPEMQDVSSRAMTKNPASTKVQDKCGFEFAGHEMKSWAKFPNPVEWR